MKKILLIAALSLVTATVGYSQGQVNFNNASSAFTLPSQGPARPVTTLGVAGFTDGSGLTGTNYLAQLFLATDKSGVLVEAPSIFRVATTTQPGTWSGGIRNLLPLYLPGDTVSVVVRVWDGGAAGATTYANSAVRGESAAFNYTIPAVGSTPAQLAMFNFASFSVSPIPEPTTIALGLLGAGSLLFLRRKK